jgi:ubiquinone/menaquinone biosynthesis C-methylase UbiE
MTNIVDLGCGGRKMTGTIGMDIVGVPGVDVVADMSRGLPFRDSSLDGVYAYHVLEHLDDFLGAVGEIWRVLKPGGRAYIKCPHAGSTFTTWKDPTHKRGLMLATFTYFDDTYFDGAVFKYYSPARFRIEKARLNFTLTDRQEDAASYKRPRRFMNQIVDALANKSRGYQYACERFWGPLVGIEEIVLTMRAIKE